MAKDDADERIDNIRKSARRPSEQGVAYDPTRIYRDPREYGAALELESSAPSALELERMVRLDSQARQLFSAVTLPVRGAKMDIIPREGDSGEAAFITNALFAPASRGGMTTPFRTVLSQMSTAILTRAAFFEKVFKVAEDGPYAGKVVGLDMGQAAMAALSTGEMFTGGPLKNIRLTLRGKRSEIRSKLDTERTPGLKALWERLSGRERRLVRHALHVVSRRIVDGLSPGDTLAIEDLTGIRERTTRRKRDRYEHNLWPYSMFRFFLEYKCALKGVSVVAVDPRNTSKTCPRCGHCERGNRRSQRLFRCRECGFQHNADWVAATNIARRAGSTGEGQCNVPPIRE